MVSANRRDLAAADTRSRILAAAADCIVRSGLSKVRMAGIATAAGVSAGLVHYHFDTKEQLFADVLHRSSEASNRLNQQALDAPDLGPAQRLSSFLDRCLPSDDRLAHNWLLWQELALLWVRQPELAKVGVELYDGLYSTLASIITAGTDQGVFTPCGDVDMVAESAVALCDGLGSRVLASDPHLTLDVARSTLALTVGVLVGFDGPLPSSAAEVH